ncbi:MAG TPA: mechanosensitive ion channel domain-containing protein [Puia sp.]|nr:mechanosensitive ion channel domain-containing protein [Puia sp.]
MYRLVLLLVLFGSLPVTLRAQDSLHIKDSARIPRKPRTIRDRKKYEHRKFDSTLFMENAAATRSDYLESVEKVFLLLDEVPVTLGTLTELDDLQTQLTQEQSALNLLKSRMSQSEKTFNIRNLQMFNTLLDELHRNGTDYAKRLNAYGNKVDTVRKQIAGFKKDTLMLHIFRDTALKASFSDELDQLRDKWRQADSLIKTNTTYIDDLKALSSENTIAVEELTSKVDNELKAVGSRAFGKERPYLWEPMITSPPTPTNSGFANSISSEQKLVKYYFSNTRNKRFWLLLTGLAFFYWVFFNYRSLRRLNALNTLDEFHFLFLRPWPVAATLVFLLSLAPLFDIHAPATYIESTQFLLMLVLSVIFYRLLPGDLFKGWCIFLLLFLVMPVIRILGISAYLERWADLFQSAASAALGIFGLIIRKRWIPGPGKRFTGARANFIIGAVGLYILLNLAAIFCNMAGRVTLSQIFAGTAVYSLAQIVSLTVFVRIVVECFLLQIQSSRVRKRYPIHFDFDIIGRPVTRGTAILAALLWLIVFTTNLNLFDAINDWLTSALTTVRTVGSFSFTLGGIVLFAGIIWIANFLQRYITYFFGDVGDDAAMDDKGQRSRLLVMRLIVLTLGFLLAVAASGLSVDRLTVILGALSVGIGLGLQSIVNNFISGVILIFDRPLRIGDTVEIGDKRGKVREIGIRSSRLLTEDGAEVIIPNGDVLSHNIVNWTLSNNYARVSLQFTVTKPANPDDLNPDTIRAIIKKNDNVLERRDPEVLISNISPRQLSLKIFFWCKDFNKVPFTTGETQSDVYQYLESKHLIPE